MGPGWLAAVGVLVIAAAEVALRLAERGGPPYPLWHDQLTTGKWHQLRRLRRARRLDVVIAGSSQALMAFDPAVLAPSPLRCYNAALYRGVPKVMRAWLRDVVLPETRPRVLVWGVSILDLNDAGRFHTDIWEKFSANPGLSQRMNDRFRLWLLAHSAIARSWRRMLRPRSLLRAMRTGAPPSAKPLATLLGPMGKGMEYVEFDTFQLRPEKATFIEQQVVAGFTCGGEQVESLRSAVRAARGGGTRVLLVELPCTEEYTQMYERLGVDVSVAAQTFARIAEAEGASFHPVTEMLPKDRFADCIHLNGVGMADWSRLCAPIVAELLHESSERR